MAKSEEDLLDDDLFDNNDFQELQAQALLATQRPQSSTPQTHGRVGTGTSTKASNEPRTTVAACKASFGSENLANQSFDYGDLDEEVLDAAVQDAPTTTAIDASRVGRAYNHDEVRQREQWRQNRFSVPSRRSQMPYVGVGTSLPHRGATPTSTPPDRGRQNAGNYVKPTLTTDFKTSSNGISLEDRIQQLLGEKERWEEERVQLQQEVKVAQDHVLGKSGEISIIRANYIKQDRERERIISELKQQQAQQGKHHKQDLEQAKKEKESLVIHNQFLDHEQGNNDWNAPAKKPGKGKTRNGSATTPKRQRVSNLGDGFDDAELTVSPSKPGVKPRVTTPKQGAKRKRDALTDTSGQPLQFNEQAREFLQDAAVVINAKSTSSDALNVPDTRFEFLQLLLGHRIEPGVRRTFEVFATLTLPSNPEIALSTLFMDRMAKNNLSRDTTDYPASVGSIVLAIWNKCLAEQYYKPVCYLVDMVKFILLNGTIATVNHLLNGIITMTQLTADVNVIPRFRTINKSVVARSGTTESEPTNDIDVYDCLELLLLTASLCASETNLVHQFWRTMRIDTLSMLLRVCQPIADITMTVKLLGPCVQDDVLGSIRDPDTHGVASEQHIIDRLTSLLIEIPRPLDSSGPYSPTTILNLRLEILQLIQQICDNKLSGRAFALHPLALGRIVRVMNDELTAIYVNISGLEERSEIVNHACRILFHVTYAYAQDIDLQEKLRSQPGGVNKYLIALSRLAFSDAIFFERGIEEDVFECAHSMLEDFVTPEEADALRRAFVREDR